MSEQAEAASNPIVSTFASDPDMAEIVEMFVDEIPERVSALETAWTGNELDEVTRIAHQLKGASGGYGFQSVGDSAGRLEQSLRAMATGSSGVCIDSIRSQYEELVSLLQRVSR